MIQVAEDGENSIGTVTSTSNACVSGPSNFPILSSPPPRGEPYRVTPTYGRLSGRGYALAFTERDPIEIYGGVLDRRSRAGHRHDNESLAAPNYGTNAGISLGKVKLVDRERRRGKRLADKCWGASFGGCD